MLQKENNKWLWATIAIIIIFGIATGITLLYPQKKEAAVSNFTECKEKGYLITDSDPRQCHTPDGKIFTEGVGPTLSEKDDLIQLETPKPNETVSSPIAIKGKARGFWFFEASFPASIISTEGNIIGQGAIMTADNWMTEDFVNFAGEINISDSSYEGNAILILGKANPSGLAEFSDNLSVPIRIYSNTETITDENIPQL
ncbi:MAG: Gmad2 immunoglobulin-like domain-containing protein [Candidatus Colwellbacteria bacterium]|jgi:hypothetical protein|nr:Gmad2 immunoglobulin-like domain-containing protein [Candidatus Colwellbacteria bacterium]MCK9497547.1 Gmad2 immunoglobulin-like domain-containing protein [Candidatus Colwellbacteria bacterium]MDD3752737.1 Gmad2 immunoglobulin-like domain-containing protein [Candidatus Colwellbacteria bacterium]MDD4818912.1 Gmad2 immunoglobulin-like domain-containing protein [Candidatus Colwellbacteria bacterium]